MSKWHLLLTKTWVLVCFPLILRSSENCASVTRKTRKVSSSQNLFFDTTPKRKHIKRNFSTCLLQAQKAEMVSRENKTASLFLLTIALSYKIFLNPQPPLTVDFLLSLFLLFIYFPPYFFYPPAFTLFLKGELGPSAGPDRLYYDA